jgi:long-chain acyl-CoA synthetase
MEVKRVFDILDLYRTTFVKKDVLSSKVNKSWKNYSNEDFINYSNWVSYALIKIGISQNDKVSIISNNRPEWNFCDYGSQQVNVVTVPIFPTASKHDLQFILNHSEAKLIFISDKSIYEKLISLEKELPHVKHIVSFEKIDGLLSFDEFINLGIENESYEKLQKIKESVLPSNLLTILYTSGTTGVPKGVMITHHNLVSNVIACQDFAPFKSTWRALSFLPLNHVYERMVCTLYLYKGVSIYYAEGLETIGDNLKDIKPQVFVSVPRLIERVYEKITATGEKLTGFKRKVFDWSIRLAHQYELNNKNGWWYRIQHKIADKLVYSKWREAVGGKLVCIASGGAALNPKLERVFLCANIVCLQGYGLTETCVVVSVNRYGEDNIRIGTCGPVIDGVSVKIESKTGEILVKGPSLMNGYYKNEAATKEVLDADGWFHTGDVGTFVEGKFLKITDRIKEIFKTSSGKYIAPLMIENKIKESRFVEQSMVIGVGEKHASALIVPSFVNFKEYCKVNTIEWTTNTEMSKHEALKKIINEHIKNVNKDLAPYEQLKRCQILSTDWSIEGGELTPKMSLKRKIIKEKNTQIINKIFAIEEE